MTFQQTKHGKAILTHKLPPRYECWNVHLPIISLCQVSCYMNKSMQFFSY